MTDFFTNDYINVKERDKINVLYHVRFTGLHVDPIFLKVALAYKVMRIIANLRKVNESIYTFSSIYYQASNIFNVM